jgi:alanine-glyoxylate transaminase/serine-glyoxylate transaminase/serine-pyruvate transaminase
MFRFLASQSLIYIPRIILSKEQITEALKKDKYKVLTFTHGEHDYTNYMKKEGIRWRSGVSVDTSTGVLSNAKMIAETVKEVSPETLVSIVSSSLRPCTLRSPGVPGRARWRMRRGFRGNPIRWLGNWCRHLCDPEASRHERSQYRLCAEPLIYRGLGVPPGLSVVIASQKALKVFEQRKSLPASYYISWAKWWAVIE